MSLFEADATTVSPKLEDFIGEGKKYKTPEDVAKALVEKDNFINRLQSEQTELRAELATRPTVDRTQEILDRIEALKKEPVAERQPEPTVPERTEVKGLSISDIDRVLNEREQKKAAQANISTVKAQLQEKFGDTWATQLKSTAEKLGVGAQFLDGIAAQSPAAFFRLIGGDAQPETLFTPPASSGASFTPTAGTPRTRSYYEKLKATDKAKYFSAEVRAQQYKDAMSLGEAYEDI